MSPKLRASTKAFSSNFITSATGEVLSPKNIVFAALFVYSLKLTYDVSCGSFFINIFPSFSVFL